MTDSKSTRRALVSSVMVILMSVSMLIGTTFAWFTDTASTGVNMIQVGDLAVDIVKEDGTTSIKNQKMDFVDANDSTDILWEPGATFKTPVFKIKNAGNLALRYKLVLNGTTANNGVIGEDDLRNVITFSVIDENDTEVSLDTFEGKLTPEAPVSGALRIQGKMDENAGNKYQGKTLDGISITVVATQDTVEFDSNDNQYDANATYPVIDSTGLSDALQNATDGSIVDIAAGEYTLPATAVSAGISISGAGVDKTVLKTDSQNYEFSGENVTIRDVTIDGTGVSKTDNNGVIKITGSNAVLDNVTLIGGGGNTYGHTARVDVNADSVTTIKNCNISGAFRGIQSYSLNGTLLIENSTLEPQCYCLNVDGGTGKLVVNNSTLMGWTSYTDTLGSATFTGCSFKVNSSKDSWGYNCVRAYTNTTFVDCDFGDEFWFGAANNAVTVTFENCRYKGTLITADNVKDALEPTDNAQTTVVVK